MNWDSGVRRLVECGRALYSCCNRQLCYRADRVQTCVIELLIVIWDLY
jgi:hypothetical protein